MSTSVGANFCWHTAIAVVRWPVPGKFLGIDGQDPCNSESNRLHVHIFLLVEFEK